MNEQHFYFSLRSISISRKRPDDIQEMSGFLTLKKNPIGTNKTAALLAATNNGKDPKVPSFQTVPHHCTTFLLGFNLLEEGAVEPGKRLVLRSVYNASLKYMTRRVPITVSQRLTHVFLLSRYFCFTDDSSVHH